MVGIDQPQTMKSLELSDSVRYGVGDFKLIHYLMIRSEKSILINSKKMLKMLARN